MGFRDERLWEILKEKAEEEDQGRRPDQQIKEKYLSAVESVCEYGVQRADTIRDTFPMYTLHNETHICNVMRLMEALLGDGAGRLSRDETAMLIMTACCHDIGMSYSEEDKEELFEDTDRLNLYLDSHCGEYVKAYQAGNDTPQMTEDMIQDYLRSIHHKRVRELLYKREWPQVLNGRIEREDLIRVCQSHGEDCEALEKIEPSPHMDLRFCGVLLRLADILDFDTSRAPEAVYEYSGFGRVQSAAGIKSKEEWDKHISSNGFDFTAVKDRSYPYSLDYSAECKSMQVEQTVNCYLDWVDRELVDCNQLLQKYNGEWQNFVLPGKINRRITSSGYKSGQYRLTLDQDQVMQLFTGENLYDDPAVFVRELIQNAIDAVRTRKQLDRELPSGWKGQINIRCWMDEEGYHWFRIEDNGIGMTEEIIRNYFLKVGCSYYNSDEFAQAKLRCRADSDYTPISRFGIGILSCFMGDKKNNRVEVNTKHFNENGEYYPALRLSMHGINGYFYLADKKEGHMPGPMVGRTENEQRPYLNQPGTVLAVRTNLYQSGVYNSFKDIVDKYVMYPEVDIHYEDEECSYDYPTEKNLMDEVHTFQPSDDPEKRGVLEIPISEEAFQKLYDKIPELEQVKRPLPKILLKCVALDEYARSPYLKGIILIGKLEHSLGSVEITIEGEKIAVDVEATIKPKGDGELELCIKLDYPESVDIKMRQILHEVSPDIPFNDWKWRNEAFCFPIENEKVQYLKEYRTKRRSNSCVWKMIDKNYVYWLKRIRKDTPPWECPNVIVHNGVICAEMMDGAYSYNNKGWEKFALLILLKDRYRPNGDISRGNILDFNLETKCELGIMKKGFEAKYCDLLVQRFYDQELLPAGKYWELLERRTDWSEQMEFYLRLNRNKEEEEHGEFENGHEFEVCNLRSLTNYFEEVYDGIQAVYDALFSAYLQMNYRVRADFRPGNMMRAYASREKNNISEKYGKYFPPFLFLSPLYVDQMYLTCKQSVFRYACNKNHRLSQFMLNYAQKLDERVPGIFYKMIRSLMVEDGDRLIRNMNAQLKALQRLPGNPFEVSDSLYLVEDDLYSCREEGKR